MIADWPIATEVLLLEIAIEMGVWVGSGLCLKQPQRPSKAATSDTSKAIRTKFLLSYLISTYSRGQQSGIVSSAEIGSHMADALEHQ